MRRRVLSLVAAAALSAPFVTTVQAAAAPAPPANDKRADAQVVRIPSKVTGTTVGSTRERGERAVFCGRTAGSVWYRFTATQDRGIVVTLAANGNLDAELDVFKQVRSRLNPVACDRTDDLGKAATSFRAARGSTYYIRVAEQPNTQSDTFTLRFLQGPPPASPPGRFLPRTGARGTLDRVLHTDVAYHRFLPAGQPFRFNLVSGNGNCMRYEVFPPETTSFDSTAPVFERSCGGYGVYTAPVGMGGRYFIRVTANRAVREPQPYKLLAGAAQRDDIAPGLLLRNHQRVTRSVNGGSLDVLDLYRFGVARLSSLDVRLRARGDRNLNLELGTDTGRLLKCACAGGPSQSLELRIPRGRYFIVVRSRDTVAARYTLVRLTRTITTTGIRIDGHKFTQVRPHTAVAITTTVLPATSGPLTLSFEHFDPLEGWLPYRQRALFVRQGSATLRWTPPSPGRWRVKAQFLGTHLFAPSASHFAAALVAHPLGPQAREERWSLR